MTVSVLHYVYGVTSIKSQNKISISLTFAVDPLVTRETNGEAHATKKTISTDHAFIVPPTTNVAML
jgi:hypothetical protein